MRKQVKRNALGKERASSSRDGRKDRLTQCQKAFNSTSVVQLILLECV